MENLSLKADIFLWFSDTKAGILPEKRPLRLMVSGFKF